MDSKKLGSLPICGGGGLRIGPQTRVQRGQVQRAGGLEVAGRLPTLFLSGLGGADTLLGYGVSARVSFRSLRDNQLISSIWP